MRCSITIRRGFVYYYFTKLLKEKTHLNGDYNGSPTSATYIYGAASKGIIKRDQQHNSNVYKTLQASPNPFQSIDPKDIEKYKKEVAERQLKDQGLLT